MTRWRALELATEAVRNTTGRRAVDFLVSVMVLGAVGLYTSDAALSALAREHDLRAAGSLVWTAVAADERPIPSDDCAKISVIGGVVAVGGYRSDTAPELGISPRGRAIPSVYVLPQTFMVWRENPSSGVVLGSELVETSRLARSSSLVDLTTGERLDVAAATLVKDVPVSILRSRVSVVSAPLGTVSECVVRFTPDAYPQGRAVLATSLHESAPLITPFTDADQAVSPRVLWASDMARQPVVVGLAILALLQLVQIMARRTELAIYLAFDTRRRELAVVSALEQAIVLIPAMAVAVAASAVFLSLQQVPFDPLTVVGLAATQIGASALAALGFALVTMLLLPKRRAFSWLKDR